MAARDVKERAVSGEIESDGAISPFMLEPQHGTSSEEEDDSETMESEADGTIRSRPGNATGETTLIASYASGGNPTYLLPRVRRDRLCRDCRLKNNNILM